VADSQRIEELRRRVQKDPASIAFAQLAEELRRAGQFEESIEACRTGLAVHPGYLSARVTLGRALVELNRLDDALVELEHVLASAPENLAAIRGVAEIHHRRGELAEALKFYRTALSLAKNDPDLQQTVDDLARKVEPPKSAAVAEGLSLEQITRELSAQHPPPKPAQPVEAPPPVPSVEAPKPIVRDTGGELEWGAPAAPAEAAPPVAPVTAVEAEAPATPQAPVSPQVERRTDPEEVLERVERTTAALQKWLDAIHVARTDSGS
jgi:tetratricopeptide (TPR) repeat protein